MADFQNLPVMSVIGQPTEDTAAVINPVRLREECVDRESARAGGSQYVHANTSSVYDDSLMNDNGTLTNSDIVSAGKISTNHIRDPHPLMKRSSLVLKHKDPSRLLGRDRSEVSRQDLNVIPLAQSFDITESTDMVRLLENTAIRSDTTGQGHDLYRDSQWEQTMSDVKLRDCEYERHSLRGEIAAYDLKIRNLKIERTALLSRLHQFVCSNAELHEELERLKIELETEKGSGKMYKERQLELGQELAKARSVIKGLEQNRWKYRRQDEMDLMTHGSQISSCACMDEGIPEEMSRTIEMVASHQRELKKLCDVINQQKLFIQSVLQEMGGAAGSVSSSRVPSTGVDAQARINADTLVDAVNVHPSGVHPPTSPSFKDFVIQPVYPPPISPTPSSPYGYNKDVSILRCLDINNQDNSYLRVSSAVEETIAPSSPSSQSQQTYDIHGTDLPEGISCMEIPDVSSSENCSSAADGPVDDTVDSPSIGLVGGVLTLHQWEES